MPPYLHNGQLLMRLKSRIWTGLVAALLCWFAKTLRWISTDVKEITLCGIETKETSNLIDLFNIEAPIVDFMRKPDTVILCSSNSGATM